MLLDAAEQIGFVVLAKLSSPVDESGVDQSAALLGWVLPDDWRSKENEWRQWLQARPRMAGVQDDGKPVPDSVRFLIDGPDSRAGLPRILHRTEGELGRLE